MSTVTPSSIVAAPVRAANGLNDLAAQIASVIASLAAVPGTIRRLRQLAGDHPEEFFKVAVKYLESSDQSPATRALTDLLARQDSTLDNLVNPRMCPTATAIGVFRRLLAADPTLDFRLARLLPGRKETPHEKVLTGSAAARALDILDQTSPGQRLLSVVGHLPNSSDARISAKAALFVGHRVSNPAWLEKQLVREDPRVRANAVESAWGSKSEPAIRILEECANDSNNRVAGNALIGLHLAGCPDVTLKVIGMSLADDPGRRSAAAWVMGKIGSPDFVDCLTTLIRDTNPKVRSTALRSLAEIRRSETKRLELEAEREKQKLRPIAETVPETIATPESSETAESKEPDTLNIAVPSFGLRLDGSFTPGSKK